MVLYNVFYFGLGPEAMRFFIWRYMFLNNSAFYIALEKVAPLHLNKFKLPLPKDDLCQVWLNGFSDSWDVVENEKKVYR